MVHGIVIIFLVLASLFTVVHIFATATSLYWFYWWLDLLMHFWGGTLIAIGLHAFSTFTSISFRPNTRLLISTLVLTTVSWELFEWFSDLHQPAAYLVDTAQDILLGLSGGLLAHFLIQAYRMK